MDIGTIVAIGIGVIFLFAILIAAVVALVNGIAEKGDEIMEVFKYEREDRLGDYATRPSHPLYDTFKD